jgi:hypothetical protein
LALNQENLTSMPQNSYLTKTKEEHELDVHLGLVKYSLPENPKLIERFKRLIRWAYIDDVLSEYNVPTFMQKFLSSKDKEKFYKTFEDQYFEKVELKKDLYPTVAALNAQDSIASVLGSLTPEQQYALIDELFKDADPETRRAVGLDQPVQEYDYQQIDPVQQEAMQRAFIDQRINQFQSVKRKGGFRVDQLNSQTRGQAVSRENIQALLDLADGNENAQTNPTAQDFGIQNPGTNQIYNQGPQGSPSRSQTSTTNNTPPPRPSTPNPRANQVNNPKPSNSRSKLQNLQQKPSRTNSAFSVPNQNRPNPGNQRPTPVQPPRPQQSNPNYQTGGNRPGVAKTFTFGTAHQNPQNHQNPQVRPPAPNPRQNQSRPAPQQPSNGANPQTPPPGDPTKSVFNQSVKKRNGGLDDLLG